MRKTSSVVLFGLAVFTWTIRANDPAKNKFEMTKEEKILLDLTNKERKDKDLPALRASPLLFKVARAHSVNMAKQKKMSHNLDGKTSAQRMKDAGYKYFAQGENVAEGDFPQRVLPLDILMKGWMESKGHRENILKPVFTEIGLGIARDDKGNYYFTQLFGKPR
jgi:uncharacterized protein YkwD